MTASSQRLALGTHAQPAADLAAAWADAGFCERLRAADYSLWVPSPEAEITDRLGWVDLPETMQGQVPQLLEFAAGARDDGIERVVLLGMGGSSLAPEVFATTFDDGPVRLTVLDSTHPDAVRSVAESVDLDSTLFIVASKSGTTIEPLSFLEFFWQLAGEDGSRFVAISDPGSPLGELARERGFRGAFEATPDVGGRYSALTAFGLVPAALIGAPVDELLAGAAAMRRDALTCSDGPLLLGAALAVLAAAGRDKATFFCSPSISAFPAWAEQLIAESTGKSGRGIVPVAGETPGPPEVYGQDRVFIYLAVAGDDDAAQGTAVATLEAAGHPVVRIDLPDRTALGAEMYRAEFAVAAAGAGLGINPFNQPDVQAAKEMARQAMAGADLGEAPTVGVGGAAAAINEVIATCNDGDYIGLLAFVEPTPGARSELEHMQRYLRDRTRAATTVGFGPRYLHSTGQLHKGGPNTGMFIQFVDGATRDLEVPGAGYSFGDLISAQAAGDHAALLAGGRRVVRIDLATPDSLGEINLALGAAE